METCPYHHTLPFANIKPKPSSTFILHLHRIPIMSPPNHHLSGNTPPETSKFLRTCHRLSLFLKEINNLRDVNVAKFDSTGVTTIDLLSNIDTEDSTRELKTSMQEEKSQSKSKSKSRSKSESPEYFILDSSRELENSTNYKADSSKRVTKPKTAPMTIFYGGQVIILDDVPAGRVSDLILMAENGESPSSGVSGEAIELKLKDSDLPIARRASLHKFLSKRKDRAAVRAPYYQPDDRSPVAGNGRDFDLNM